MRIHTIFTILFLAVFTANAQTTEYTFQGRLSDGSLAANGSYDFQFELYDAALGGNLFGTQTVAAVMVSNGFFTVRLNFGDQFNGTDRFLAISVRNAGGGPSYTLLNPRQQITSAPYAIKSLNAQTALNSLTADLGLDSNRLGGIHAAEYVLTGDARLSNSRDPTPGSPNYIQNGSSLQSSSNFNISGNGTVGGILSGNGAGLTNVPGTFKWEEVSLLSRQALANHGYAANSGAQVTITLPANPNIGDTIRISGVGAGGWKIAQNAGQTILGQQMATRGAWTPRDSIRNWRSVASSADGSKLVAVESGQGAGGRIYTSTNYGVIWIPRESNRIWSSVASSADGSKLVATVTNGQIYTSTNSGITWTPRETNRNWTSVASSDDGSKLVATVRPSGFIYTSNNSGVTWTQRYFDTDWRSVASSSDGNKLVAAVNGGAIHTSSDSGVTWTTSNPFFNHDWNSVASSADGTKLVAAASNEHIYTSTDSGQNWTECEEIRVWISVASSADGSKLVAAANGGKIYTSTDSGILWTERELTRQWVSVASSADGNRLVALVGFNFDGGLIYTYATTTASGTLGFVVGQQGSAIELQYIGGGQFLPLSYIGDIRTF